ncbi:MAG: sensor histidine kinase [Microbacteriaceae bacterium]|jgi:signal transduction histidine kinase|nr:sensor histidine kinase [Microbacteriaceae bacterium]
MFRSLEKYQYGVDVLVAATYYVVAVTLFGGNSYSYLDSVMGEAGFAFVAGGYAVAVGLRRVSPGLALAVAWVFSVLQMALSIQPNVFNVATCLVLYTTAAYGSRMARNLGLVSVGVGAFVAAAYLTLRGAALGVSTTIFGFLELPQVFLQYSLLFAAILFVLGMPWLLGLLVRAMMRNRESRLARERAEQDVIVEQERNRIARDMHDVVAHSLAVVIAQSDGARYARASDPAAVDEALIAISSTARQALADVRLLLGQLRHSQADGPQPSIADLDRLIDQLRASGLTIDFEQVGDPRPLGAAHELSVYRIVQEAITNALRHGRRDRAVTVRFDWTPSTLDLTITNGTTVPITTAELHIGHGLAGMTERASLVGGSLRAEPTGDSFVVSASLPAAVVA